MEIPENSLLGRYSLITGAGSGIGRAAAFALSRAGAKVALLGRTESELCEVLEAVGGTRAGHMTAVADVADEVTMAAAFEKIAKNWKSLDIVVANAGINGVWAPLEKLEIREWDETMAVNLRGTFLTTKFALPFFRESGGSVIVVSSINGNRIFSNSGATAYACSKAGQVAFVKITALELAKKGIRVNVVCPGAIETNIESSTCRREMDALHLPVEYPDGDVPLTQGRPGEVDDVVGTIWFLASDLSSHISGTEIYVDGAQSLLQG